MKKQKASKHKDYWLFCVLLNKNDKNVTKLLKSIDKSFKILYNKYRLT